MHEDDSHTFVLRSDYFEAQNECTLIEIGYPIAGGSGTSGSTEENCDRDDRNTQDNFFKLRFRDAKAMKDAESWWSGNFEIRLVVLLGNKSSNSFYTLNKPFTDNRKAYRGCSWFNCWMRWNEVNAEIVTWDEEFFGSHMKYILFEENPNEDKRELELSLTTKFGNTEVTGKSTIELNKNDFHLGSSMAEYCNDTDGDGHEYFTGHMYFYLNQK